MLDLTHPSKVKNDKILRWRMELAAFDFTTIYRPGKENCAPDTFSRAITATVNFPMRTQLKDLHETLCHPGVTRLAHYVKIKNLPFSLDDVKTVTQSCKDCCEIKASFLKPSSNLTLIKATQPFERISVDFKGPLPSISKNTYLLVIVDEFTRFPFAYACRDMKASTVIEKLTDLFSMFGFPGYLHSDQGSNFMSYEFKSWLHNLGIPTSRSSRYNPRGNGQVERLNRTLWQTILLALRTKKLPQTHWEYVLPDVLHSIRSLLCTATNCTPHERMFLHSRKSFNGVSLPAWVKPGPVYVKSHTRSKNGLLVEEAELLEANPQYAHVRLDDGREIPVSLRDLAPNPRSFDEPATSVDCDVGEHFNVVESAQPHVNDEQIVLNDDDAVQGVDINNHVDPDERPLPRRSSRIRKPIDRYGHNIYS